MKLKSAAALRWFAFAALLAATGVGLGAFGAHGLENVVRDTVSDPAKSLEHWGTANRYLLYHCFAIMIVALASLQLGFRRSFQISLSLFVIGIVLFSGSLYVLALTDFKKLGMIVPIGGLAQILGWFTFALGLISASREGTKIQ